MVVVLDIHILKILLHQIRYGCIIFNMTVLSSGGYAEMDFVKCGKYYTNTTKYAFDWYLKTIATTQDSLMILQNSGNLEVSGTITSPTITAIQTQINGAGYLINNNT